jgi:hypothetical protein
MRFAGKIALGCLALALIGLLVVGGVGHDDEVSYDLDADRFDEAVSVNVQNTGSVRRYLGLMGVRRYGPPFELFVWIEAPPGTELVVLRGLEVLDGDRRVVSVAQLEVPVEPATVFQGGRRTEEEHARYAHPEVFDLRSETVTVRGSWVYRPAGEDGETFFEQRFERRHDSGFYTGLR